MKIPIQNIYYLLCYAWNKLEERDIVNVNAIESTKLHDLFAKVLINGLNHLLKRGLDRNYITYGEDTKCLRGRVDFGQTLKRNLLCNATVHCRFDELDHNVLHNQIIKSTLLNLLRIQDLDSGLREDLSGIVQKLREVDVVSLNYSKFSRVHLHQNNSFYSFLIKICELIFSNLLIEEKYGHAKFRDFLRDEKQMAYLFEAFIRNFYKIEAKHCVVGREDILWAALSLDDECSGLLPKMTTDVSITLGNLKVVIDTKYYKEALITHYGKRKIHSDHLYQLFSYLKNLEVKGGVNINCTGVLLYPKVNSSVNLKYVIQGHNVLIRTVNLDLPWTDIHDSLLNLLDECAGKT